MRGGLADLEDQRAASDEVDPDVVNRLFRSAHSLKALAGLFGFDPIRRLAHQLEEILDGLRLGRVALESPAVSLIAEAVRVFATLLESVGDAEALEAAGGPIGGLSERIEAAMRSARTGPEAAEALDVPPAVLRTLTEYEEHRLRENLRRGRHVAFVDATFEVDAFEAGLSTLSEALRSHGELISTLPSPGDGGESQIRFSLLTASPLTADELAGRIEAPHTGVRSAMRAAAGALGPADAGRGRGRPRVASVDQRDGSRNGGEDQFRSAGAVGGVCVGGRIPGNRRGPHALERGIGSPHGRGDEADAATGGGSAA